MTDPAAPPIDAPGPVVDLQVDGHRYRLVVPDAATDYLQKKIATELQPYELEMLDDIRRHVRPGDLVVDAGANVGNHTIYLAAVAGCRVEAFEPSGALCMAIRASVALNHLEGLVRVHALGLGSAPAHARFREDKPENLGARGLTVGEGDIEVVALDSIGFNAPVRVLKIDVEGMEPEVLDGAAAIVERDRPLIYVECIGDRDFRKVSRWLDERNYVHWETFNATPTHLFLPAEGVPLDRRLARLQLKAVHEDYRQTTLLTSVRQRLTRAYDNEREARELNATLTRDLAVRDTELRQLREAQVAAAASVESLRARATELAVEAAGLKAEVDALKQTLEAERAELADIAGRRERERRQAAARTVADGATIAALQTSLSAASAELDRQSEAARTARAESEASLAALASSLSAATAELDRQSEAARTARAESEASLAALASSLSTATAELNREREAAFTAQAESEAGLAALTSSLSAATAELNREREAARTAQAESEARLAALHDERAAMAETLDRALHAERALQGRLTELQAEGDRLRDAVAAAAAGAEQLRAELGQSTSRTALLEQQLAELRDDRLRLQRALELRSGRLEALEIRLERTRSSSSFLVGAALVASTRSVADAARLPLRLWQIYRDRAERRAQRQALEPPKAGDAPRPAKPPAATRSLPGPDTAPATTVPATPPSAPRPAAAPPAPAAAAARVPGLRVTGRLRELRVACIFDEFTYHSFAPECELLQLRSDAWNAQVDGFEPDLVFIESAWRGVDESWQRKISEVSPELLGLLEWALHARVPTAFWCKEDPVHFVRFLPVARLVDHVFTTDIDCIPRYMAALGHGRVHLLPFAAQPAMHNPVESAPREDGFCFAGSYYRKYPERQADFHQLVSVGRTLKSVVIYDRNSNRPRPHDFDFPDEYRAEVREALDYAQVDRAYKGYRYGITVNTIKQSQTMFARRAFELMACNTVVVSNFSRGLRLFFGDLAVASDNARELEHRLQPVCSDERHYRSLRLHALRNVLAQHTYAHRLAYVATRISGRQVEPDRPKVGVVAAPATRDEAQRVVEAVRRQTYRQATLLLLGPADVLPADADGARHLTDRAALAQGLGGFEFIAVFDPADHYGPDYLTDLALATTFAQGDGLTKASFFRARDDGTAELVGDGQQYRPTPTAALRRSLVRVDAVRSLLADPKAPLATAGLDAGSFLAVDEFGYCEGARTVAAAFDGAAVDGIGFGRPPADFAATVLRTAESITIPAAGGARQEPFFTLSANELARLLPRKVDPRISVDRDPQQRIVVTSTLGAADHTYLYLSRQFAPSELMSGSEMRFLLDAEADLNACTVFVFRNAADQKISQLTDRVGAPHALRTPAGTDHVRLALRIQGPGRAVLGRLRITPAHREPIQAIPTVATLVVARSYPAYDDLYRYAFVHSRVRAYARAGAPAHVLRLVSNPDPSFREFEDVDVIEADENCLDHFLATRCYRNVLLHLADSGMWEVVRKHLDHARVTIWVHGAEIQPWWRRAFGGEPDAANDWARGTNDARLAMWREILGLRHPNLSLVFISHRQLREVIADLRLRPADLGHVEVVHNFVDTERFEYRPKPAAMRTRVLSIRPFSSAVYGNDLSVKAILLLSREPFFHELQFRIVGDGKRFDETVAPLRGLPNVEISKGFLTQRQIADLHREYGVFLVPSRMDSQGVSRDEAMASGLVPVTNRVASIPEFVDPSCGFLAEPEDAAGLASAIAALYHDPERFEAMSAAAARRVRGQSGYAQTVARELALLARDRPAADGAVAAQLATEEAAQTHIAVYGDVNLNIVDGSAIWAASLAETLAGADGVRVVLLLKARVKRTLVLSRLLDLAPRVQLVEPPIRENEVLSPAQAVAEIAALATLYPLRAVVLRGLHVCDEATRVASLRGRIWAYLTDIPQRAEDMDEATRTRIASIIDHSEFVLCQTPQMQTFVQQLFPAAVGRTRILPPMIPAPEASRAEAAPGGPLRVAYAGKFAPRWGIEEMFEAFAQLRAGHADAELHVYGDKFHQSAEVPDFRDSVQARLRGGNGVVWHGAVDRDALMRELSTMQVCWAFRDPAFERECLELSTKALEYASLRVPVVMARGAVNESVFGADYPLFADSAAHAAALLRRLADEPEFRTAVARALQPVAQRFGIQAVHDRLVRDGLLPGPGAVEARREPARIEPAAWIVESHD